MGENDPRMWCGPILTCGPKGMVGRIYVVNHYYVLLHTKYRSCRFMVSKVFFKSYSPLYGKSEGLANLEPRGMVGMIYVGDHQALLYTNLVYKLWALWLWNRRFLKFFPNISLCELLIPMGMTSFHPRGFYVGHQ